MVSRPWHHPSWRNARRDLAPAVLLWGCIAACEPRAAAPTAPEAEPCFDAVSPGQRGETVAAELGLHHGGVFVPIADGDRLALVSGFQGGFMITPLVRVAALDTDPDTLCADITLSNVAVAGATELPRGVHTQVLLERTGDYLESGAVNDLLGFEADDLVGVEIDLDATVDTGSAEGQTRRRVVLAAPP